jgi:hypothetical protein
LAAHKNGASQRRVFVLQRAVFAPSALASQKFNYAPKTELKKNPTWIYGITDMSFSISRKMSLMQKILLLDM